MPLHALSDAGIDILVAELRANIRSSERREEDLRQEPDRWRTAFENRQRLLSPPSHQGAPVPAAARWRDMSWRGRVRWLRSTG